MIISDLYQQKGLGVELLQRLLQVGRDENLKRITADILPDNYTMQRICEKLGFRLQRSLENQVTKAYIDL
jgi:acetyltransferase